jgi:hypothetical protein
MFEIKVADTDVSGGTIPVSWCLDVETLKKLSDDSIRDPQVVIVTAPVNNYARNKEYRQVFPLKDLMGYVEFRSAGENKIWAFISGKKAKDAKNEYLSKSQGKYITDILESDNSGWSWIFHANRTPDGKCYPAFGAEPLTVNVPTGVFAPEPSEMEKVWVNHFFKDKCVDQCEFRRRRMFAYGLQPLLMLGQLVVRSFFLLAALLYGSKKISAMPLLHPLRHDMGDVLDTVYGRSIFFHRWWTVPFMPIILILITLISVSGKAPVIFALLATIGLVVGIVAFFATESYVGVIDWIKKKLEGDPNEPLWYVDQNEIDMLTCSPSRKPFTFKTLPAKKKTLSLRFNDIKSKVCRPFSA